MSAKTNKNQEWLQTNDLGGFCSGSVSGPPTRRYQGLLCASLNPPTDRYLLVSHLLETVFINQVSTPLSNEHYLQHLPVLNLAFDFKNQPYAHWCFNLEGGKLEKSVLMLKGENTSLVRYKNVGHQPLTLFVKPLLALRDYHTLREDNPAVDVTIEGNTVCAQTWGEPKVFLASNLAHWEPIKNWYHQLYYSEEAARGFEATEDNFCPADINALLAPGEILLLKFSTQPGPVSEKPFLEADKCYASLSDKERFKADLELAARQFIVHRESSNSSTILAGYPWFTDWGRDTLISLRDFQDFMEPNEAQQIIKTFLQYEKNGLIPNRFPDNADDDIEYNTVDATLWLFVAVWELQQKHQDLAFIQSIFSSLTKIIKAHIEGTDFNIKVLESGLLRAGEAPWQLTWMDAKIGDYTVTPRSGCAVEINALWYNALKIYQSFQKTVKDKTLDVKPYIKTFEKSFASTFWNDQMGGLYDVVIEAEEKDEVIRPNQVYALSLPFTILPKAKQKKVLQQIGEKLYTPFGLRTLALDNPDFKPEYKGDTWERDEAYHQGTVWPFLLREYFVAYEKIYGSKKAKLAMSESLEAFKNHFYHDAGIGSVSEIFDGGHPLHGKGCPAQAWSVAALWKLVKMAE